MGFDTSIEWCDATFNPWIGCSRVSEGCRFCYAETLMDKRWGKVQWGPQGERKRTSDAKWREPVRWNQQAKREGRRYRVFCASLADVFEDRAELVDWRRELLDLIVHTPHLDWLLLTKRPENINRMIEQATGFSEASMWFHAVGDHVWIGTSVEHQAAANQRVPELLRVPAKIRFLSCEPLLGPVDLLQVGPEAWDVLHGWKANACNDQGWANTPAINWVIVGGESGPGARPMSLSWAESIIQQCRRADVPVHVKQLGSVIARESGLQDRKGGNWLEWPEHLRIREYPA